MLNERRFIVSSNFYANIHYVLFCFSNGIIMSNYQIIQVKIYQISAGFTWYETRLFIHYTSFDI